MTYRRDRSIREVYDERFLPDRPGPYPRPGGGGERRGPFGRPDEEYGRGGYEYEGGPRFYPNGGGPRGYHEDQRGYQGDGHHFPAERRGVPPSRREDYSYRGQREEPNAGRPMEFSARAPPPPPPPHSVRNQGIYPAARSLPESDDTLVQAIRILGEERETFRRKAGLFPPIRERSPVRREVAHSPHSRSGSSVSSRGYSPDRAKTLPFPSQQGKSVDGPEGHTAVSEHLWGALFPQSGHDTLDKIPGLSREGSPNSATSNKEESQPPEAEKEEPLALSIKEEVLRSSDVFQERRAQAIVAKAQEIEKVYRQDCETFGMVVKMLVAKDPNLEKQLQVPLRENLGEIRERCLEDLKHFISELDEVVRQPEHSASEPAAASTSTTSHKLSKTAVNHSSSY
ncbi:periphilin-1 isoform X3 [Cololabis saira]|uniref:periphilin-1 isoform X3 n=1 Tax=Cololabis saira TaxID=129043 RepID=UPI002AD1F2A1|nr:periphilin-1 isoform X3 [Cololabis saira]